MPLILILVFTFSFLVSPLAQSAILSQSEVHQTRATVHFHAKRSTQCINELEKILRDEPKDIKALELKALCMRQAKNDSGARRIYQHLIEISPKKKRAGYHFELGTIDYKQKNNGPAKKHFQKAVLGRINPGMSHFFLGIMEFKSKEWRKAVHHFSAALSFSDSKSVTAVSRYYLANAYAQHGKSMGAVRNYHVAKLETTKGNRVSGIHKISGINKFAGNIHSKSEKALAQLDKGSFFASVSLLGGWDDNVQSITVDAEKTGAASDQQSFKTILSGTAGYTTSPANVMQFIPSYSFYGNYNFNKKTKSYNFISHTPSVKAYYKPYQRLSPGVKVEATYSMKNNTPTTNQVTDYSNIQYQRFSFIGSAGPILKYELNPMVILSSEHLIKLNKYYQEPAGGEDRRSGRALYNEIAAEFISEIPWFEPTFTLSMEIDEALGNNYKAVRFGLGFSNTVQINKKLSSTLFFDTLLSNYRKTTNPSREDFYFSVRGVGNYKLTNRVSGMVDLSWISNDSSNSSGFKYNRFVASLGATYSF